jgi:exodeoxyribonuclease VII small subunit
MSRRKASPPDPSSQPSFEESLTQLEQLIDAMEHQSLPLEQLVAHYEQGSSLLQHCESILDSARKRIELITIKNQEPPSSLPASQKSNATAAPAATVTLSSLPEAFEDDQDDIRLF